MSDFEDIVTEPTQEGREVKLLDWTSRILDKWRRTGLTELEGYQLLLFWTQKHVGTSAGRQRRRERRFEENGKLNGLQYAAIVFEKDERTIRRWCEKKYFQGANRTKGGHWRIPFREVEQVWSLHSMGFGRGVRSLFGTKIWKEFKKDAQVVFGNGLWEATAMEAALQDKSQREFLTAPVPFSDETLDRLKSVNDSGQTGYANLRYLARRLYKEEPNRPLNYSLLADALNINPSTLYRRYSKEEIKSAIKSASKPLKQWEIELQESDARGELTDAEKDAAEIQQKFSNSEVEKNTTSPYFPPRDATEIDQ